MSAFLGWLWDAFDVTVEWVGNALAFVLAAVLLLMPFAVGLAFFWLAASVVAWAVG